MSITETINEHAGGRSTIRRLLSEAAHIGGIYQMGYREAVVLTNDKWKRDAHGVPKGCYLIASTFAAGDAIGHQDDEELILLRVEGTAPLPAENELIASRMDAMRAALETGQQVTSEDVIDHRTLNEIQFSALRCRVLGTFYDDNVGRHPFLEFGADLDNVYSAARYHVYKPTGAGLADIASYPRVTRKDLQDGRAPQLLDLGVVRFSSTRRRANSSPEPASQVDVRVEDFVALKTAVFGMTRAGKSNTVKVLASAVFEHSRQIGEPIGQLILDPSGEYAAANVQDNTALRLIGPEWVSVFRFGADGTEHGVRPLNINFYGAEQCSLGLELIRGQLANETGAYLNAFLGADFDEPVEAEFPTIAAHRSAHSAWSRGMLGYYATLAEAGFRVPERWAGHNVSMKGDLADRVLADHPNALTKNTGPAAGSVRVTSRDGLRDTFSWLLQHVGEDDVDDWAKHDITRAVMTMRTGGTRGLNVIRGLGEFHSPAANADYRDDVYADLVAGRIVIIDMALGSERVAAALSERLVLHLLERGKERFRNRDTPHRMQVCLEEAHLYFSRKDFEAKAQTPWVRLAKEAAKYQIGMIYATQEVSDVDKHVLSNTHNFVVAHLNSRAEIKELSKYFDFEDFADDILHNEDRGYVRMKTLSGKFIVPVQVHRFTHDHINRARTAAGLAPVDADGNPIAARNAAQAALDTFEQNQEPF